jgi:hypothetical protein
MNAQEIGNAGKCPENPCMKAPWWVVVVSIVWLLALVAAFACFERVAAFADFASFELGPLPFETIWFGAVGGWLISAQGIFNHNYAWRRSYDYWHCVRPVTGAIMGTLGCLVFLVLSEAATQKAIEPNPVFFDVLALTIGYREKSFRDLLLRVIDTILLPGQPTGTTAGGQGGPGSPPDVAQATAPPLR